MLEPFSCISNEEFNIFSCPIKELSEQPIPKEYIEYFPILQRYNYLKSPSSHYELFKQLLFATFVQQERASSILKLDNAKDREAKKIEIFDFFVSLMPKYPSVLCSKLSPKLVNDINAKAPKTLIKIILKNPSLFSRSTDPLIDSILQLISPKLDDDDKTLNHYLKVVADNIDENNYESFAPLITQIFQTKKMATRKSPALISIINSCIKYGADKVMNANFPSVIMKLSDLIPLTLISEEDVQDNGCIYAALRVYGFAFRLVTSFIENKENPREQMNRVLTIHRFIKSGYVAIDAYIVALIAYGDRFMKCLLESKKNISYLAATSVACVLSCFELPSLKIFVQNNFNALFAMLKQARNASVDSAKQVFSVFLDAFGSLVFSPMRCLFISWINNQEAQNIPFLSIILSLNETDELFAPLVVEAAEIIANGDLSTTAEIAKRLMLTGPSPASRYALKELAAKCDPDIFFKNLNYPPITLFVPAMHLIALRNQKLELNSEISIIYIQVILSCASSESSFSLFHLEYLSEFIELLTSRSFSILLENVVKCGIRGFLRFLLMITKSPKFSQIMMRRPKDFDIVITTLRGFVDKIHDDSVFAAIAIIWRNMTINFNEKEFTQKTNMLFQYGTRALALSANRGTLVNLITAAFCDVLSNKFIIPKLVQVIKSCLKDKTVFQAALQRVDEDILRREFPAWEFKKGAKIQVPKLPDEFWGHKGWEKYMSSKIILI